VRFRYVEILYLPLSFGVSKGCEARCIYGSANLLSLDLPGTGNNNKLNWVLDDKQELIDIIETIYRGAKKGRGLVVSPKDYSTRYRY
jgi:DIM1 family U5 snRNP protein